MDTPIQNTPPISPGPSPELLNVLVCPVDHGALSLDSSANQLRCSVCQRIFPIQNGIPNMLVK